MGNCWSLGLLKLAEGLLEPLLRGLGHHLKAEGISSNFFTEALGEGLKEGKRLVFELEEGIFLSYGAHVDV